MTQSVYSNGSYNAKSRAGQKVQALPGPYCLSCVPLGCFCLTLYFISSYPESYGVWGICCVFAAAFLLGGYSNRDSFPAADKGFYYLVMLCGLGFGLGICFGVPVSRHASRLARPVMSYRNVSPMASAAVYSDAGAIMFSHGVNVNWKMHAGYRNLGIQRTTYCVAPIFGDKLTKDHTDFWVAGENCCRQGINQDGQKSTAEQKTEFNCGAVADPKARAGRAIPGALYPKESNPYMKAVLMAQGAYGIKASNTTMLLDWVADGNMAPIKVKNQWVGWNWGFLCMVMSTAFIALGYLADQQACKELRNANRSRMREP